MRRITLLFCILAILTNSAFSREKNNQLQNTVDNEYSNTLIDNFKQAFNGTPDINNIHKFDVTSLLIDAKRNWDKLSKSAKDYIDQLQGSLNDLTLSIVSPNGYFKYWFTDTGTNAIDETDANNNGTPDQIDFYDSCFTLAKTNYINAGYTMPAVDSYYDIYISNSACGDGIYGYTSPKSIIGDNPASPEKEINSCKSYIVIRNDFSSLNAKFEYGVKITSAHEFFHSVQMAIDVYKMNLFVMEGCAVWAEEWNHKGIYDGFQYLTDYFKSCDVQLNYKPTGSTSDTYYARPYATWIFYRYLTDMYGDGIIKKLYYNHINTNGNNISENNAFELTLNAYGSDYQTAVKNFFITQFVMSNLEDKKPVYFSIADTLSEHFSAKLEKTIILTNDEYIFNSKTTGNQRLQMLSTDYFRISGFNGANFSLTPQDSKDTMVLVVIRSNAINNPTNFDYQEIKVLGQNTVSLKVEKDSQFPYTSIVVMNLKMANSVGVSSYYTLDIIPDYNSPTQSVEDQSNSFKLIGISPMPAGSNSNLNISTDLQGLYSYQIFNIDGKSIDNGNFIATSNSNSIPLDFSNYSSGIYLIQVSNGKETRSTNFIVK